MSAVEPHPRRPALRRALATAVLAGALLLGGPASAQTDPTLLPPTTDEPAETTTTTEAEAPPTTEDEPEPTRTEQPTATTRAPTTTEGSFDVGDGPDDVIDDDVVDDDTVVEEVPQETTSTGRDLLVSGDGSDGAESTTTTSTTVVEVAADEEALDEETQIWLIVAGLVVVAALIGVWTWRYWVRTRPAPVEKEADPTTVFPAG